MNFLSDTAAPAHPSVLEALMEANTGSASSYGSDPWTLAARNALCELFETDLEVWFVSSGTAANALALSVMCKPDEAILCHREAHIHCDERGAPEFFTAGAKLRLLDGTKGQITPDKLLNQLDRENPSHVHETPSTVLSLTNLTECGTSYQAQQIADLGRVASDRRLRVHLDGARLVNALAHTGDSPADASWRAGVDVLTFGMTKTGAMGCEAIILFGDMKDRFSSLLVNAKRGGHMPPKQRYLAAQMSAMLDGGLWRRLAQIANEHAAQLAQILINKGEGCLRHPVEGNEIFIELPDKTANILHNAGVGFCSWPFGGYRFVCSWNTTQTDLDAISKLFETAP